MKSGYQPAPGAPPSPPTTGSGVKQARQATIELDMLKAATERLFEHRKTLRSVAVRIGFWPAGLRIAAAGSIDVIPWNELASIGKDELLARIDRVCGVVDWQRTETR